jgi:hypothetical protein
MGRSKADSFDDAIASRDVNGGVWDRRGPGYTIERTAVGRSDDRRVPAGGGTGEPLVEALAFGADGSRPIDGGNQ